MDATLPLPAGCAEVAAEEEEETFAFTSLLHPLE
jgi:hypothetical protein